MGEDKKKTLPDYLEIVTGDTVYKITSVFAVKGDFHTLWETLIIDRAMRRYDCKAV